MTTQEGKETKRVLENGSEITKWEAVEPAEDGVRDYVEQTSIRRYRNSLPRVTFLQSSNYRNGVRVTNIWRLNKHGRGETTTQARYTKPR